MFLKKDGYFNDSKIIPPAVNYRPLLEARLYVANVYTRVMNNVRKT